MSSLLARFALPVPPLSESALPPRIGSREWRFPAAGSAAPSVRVRARQSSAFCGVAGRGTVSADGTVASRFEARDNRPVAPDTCSDNAVGIDNSGSLDPPESGIPMIDNLEFRFFILHRKVE